MIIELKLYFEDNMFIGWYMLTRWEVDVGQEVCMGWNMVKGH